MRWGAMSWARDRIRPRVRPGPRRRTRRLAGLAIAGLVCGVLTLAAGLALAPGVAAAESAWQEVPGAKVRLVTVGRLGPDAKTPADAALEIQLEPGWHTYWRFPGEAGIPTEADFARSRGLRGATLRFPAPKRYFDGQTTSIVYTDRVVLPIDLDIDPQATSAMLSADVTFGVCRDICVPATAALSLEIGAEDGSIMSRMAITRARLAIPKPQSEAAPRIARIAGSTPDANGERTLTIEARLAPGALEADLFAEGAPGSYIEVPRRIARDGTSATFALTTHGLARTDDGRPLSLVLVNGPVAVRHAIDADTLSPR